MMPYKDLITGPYKAQTYGTFAVDYVTGTGMVGGGAGVDGW